MSEELPRNIAHLCQRSRDISLEKGWLNEDGTDPRPFHTVTALFHSELSEAFEEVRDNKKADFIYYEVKIKEDGGDISKSIVSAAQLPDLKKLDSKYGRGREFLDAKPCGIPIEFADFVIRVAQYYGSAGTGEKLDEAVAGVHAALDGVELEVQDIEQLISELHNDVAMANIATQIVKAGNVESLEQGGFPEDPLTYHASALFTLFRFCAENNIDLWAAIEEKEAFNRTRPRRHGGKKV